MVTNKFPKFSGGLLLLMLVALSAGAQAQSESGNGARRVEPSGVASSRMGVVAKVTRSLQATRFAAPDSLLAKSPFSPTSPGKIISPGTVAAVAGPGTGIHAVISGSLSSKFAGLRDPFRLPSPPAAGTAGIELHRPRLPGKHGLIISQLKLVGIVRQHGVDSADTGSMMIAVVTNSSNVAYFLHPGDALYDGRITMITADRAVFEQEYVDPEGQVKRREVVKRLNAASGEEQ
ncbi:MAG TPA: hypothetical protein VG204_15045 [Terriglobia bacterium]|nr:hypothetical protein [Terriglobia bacterium]